MNDIIRWIEKKASWFLSGEVWLYKCTSLCVLFVIIFSCPLIKKIAFEDGLIPNKYNAWGVFERQKEHPFDQNIYDSFDKASHESKLAFRFTVPLIAKIAHFSNVYTYLMQVIMGVMQFLLVGIIVFQRFKDKTIALLLMISYCFIYCGYMSFSQYSGVFDGVSIFFILLALYFKEKLISVPFLLLAYFNDERSVLVLVIITVINYLSGTAFYKNKIFLHSFWSILLYVIIRLLLQYLFSLHTTIGENTGVNFDVFLFNISGIGTLGKGFQLDFMLALEGFWIIYLIFAYQKFKTQKLLELMAIFGSIIPLTLVSAMVFDSQRSLAYLFPTILVLIYHIDIDTEKMKRVAFCILTGCFLIPTHPISSFVNTIGPTNSLPYILYDLIISK